MSLEKQTAIEENLQKTFNEDSFRESLSAADFENYLASRQMEKSQKGFICFKKERQSFQN